MKVINYTEVRKQAPTVTMLRRVVREAESQGHDLVIIEYGEQYCRFEKHNGRWYHNGNGLLRAGYKLADELSAAPAAERLRRR